MLAAKEVQTHFAMDMKASLFTVQAFASGMVAVVAHSPKFAVRDLQGAVLFCPDALEMSSISLSAGLASLDILDEVTREERRAIERVMFDEVLETGRYPIAEFQSSRVRATQTTQNMYSISVAGDMTLHGISRGLGFDGQLVTGTDTLRIQGSFSLLQSDYGLKIASVANGTLKLKDQLKFAFFLVARRKE
jgi:polyisoprenoid-binding protein YceI